VLSLKGNSIDKIENLENLTNLKSLDLSRNYITEILILEDFVHSIFFLTF